MCETPHTSKRTCTHIMLYRILYTPGRECILNDTEVFCADARFSAWPSSPNPVISVAPCAPTCTYKNRNGSFYEILHESVGF